MRHPNRDTTQRLDALSNRAYALIALGTPSRVSRGLGVLLFVANWRERLARDKQEVLL